MGLMELHEKELFRNQEHLDKGMQGVHDLEHRVRRLEDRERFDCDREARKTENKKREVKEEERNGEGNYFNLNKRLKLVEDALRLTVVVGVIVSC